MATTHVFDQTSVGVTIGEERVVPLAFGAIPPQFVGRIDQIISADHATPVANLDEALDIALGKPIGQSRLQGFIEPHHKIALIVSDKARKIPREKIIDAVHREIPHVPYSQFTIIIANGTHVPSKPEELGLLEDFIKRYKWVSHNSTDYRQLKYIGRTPWKMRRFFLSILPGEIKKSWEERSQGFSSWWNALKRFNKSEIKQLFVVLLPVRLFLFFLSGLGMPILLNRAIFDADWIISIGQIQPHYFAGYSGGIKNIFPGVAAKFSIAFNHFMKVHKTAKIGNLEGNIIRDDLETVAKLLHNITILNIVGGPGGKIYGAVSGDPILAHRTGTKICKNANIGKFKSRSDIVVVSAGEPMGRSIYQLCKALVPASFVVKAGGTIICTGSCRDGIGGSALVVNQIIYRNGIKQYLPRGVTLRLVSDANPRIVDKTFLKPSPSIVAALEDAFSIYGNDATLSVIPEAAHIMVMQVNTH